MNAIIRRATLLATFGGFGLACALSAPGGSPSPSPDILIAPAKGSMSPEAPDFTATATETFAPLPPLATPFDPPASQSSWLKDTSGGVGTAEGYAAGGDNFERNLYERPFDKDQKYRPDLDIQTIVLTRRANWVYALIQLSGLDPTTNSLHAWYGVEMDVDRNGRGKYLVWAAGPYSTEWTRDGMRIYQSDAGGVGGPQALLSDAPWSGVGYATWLYRAHENPETNAAWVRIAPDSPTLLQIAFSLDGLGTPNKFLWSAWADDGLHDPAQFDYNDRFTKTDAGSPLMNDENYPPKAIWAVDNTCRAPFGFNPNGNEPGLCNTPPEPTKTGPTRTPTRRPAIMDP